MTCAPASDMAFARAMDYTIDKEDFWQLASSLSSSAPQDEAGFLVGECAAGEPRLNHHHHHQDHQDDDEEHDGDGEFGGQAALAASHSDFFDQFVVMDMEGVEAPMSLDLDHSARLDHQLEHLEELGQSGHRNDQQPGHHGLGLAGEGDGLSPPNSASSATEPISVTSAASSHVGEDQRSVDMMSVDTSIPSVASSTGSSYCPSAADGPQRPRLGQTGSRQGQQIGGAQSADSTTHVVLGHLNPETLEQRRRLLSGRRGQHQPAGGSITDSELLRLEGLSVNSPHGMGRRIVPSASSTTSASPPLLAHHGLSSTTSIPTSNGSCSSQHHQQHRPAARTPAATTSNTNTTSSDDIDLCNLAKTNGKHSFKSGSRKFESIYSTIRRAVGGRGHISPQKQQQQQQQQQQKQQQQQQQQQQEQQKQPQHPKTAPIPQTVIPSHMESARKATRRLASESQLMWDGLPISPPLTDMSHPSHTQGSDTAAFVAGLMEDPFFDPSVPFNHHHHQQQHHQHHNQNHHDGNGVLGPAAQINSKSAAFNSAIPTTPLATPQLKHEAGADDGSNYFPATSEGWSLDGNNFVTSSDMSHSTSFMSGGGAVVDAWSFDPSSDVSSGMNFTTAASTEHSHDDHDAPHHGSSRNLHNLTIQVPRYAAPSLSHDHAHHTPGSDDLSGSGLMIHMPQPRTPSTAPLLSSSSQMHHQGHHHSMSMHEAVTSPMYPFPVDSVGTPQHHHAGSMHSFRGPYTDHGGHSFAHNHPGSRRPKPRAPSSGARYHHGLGLSPRKVRQPSSSSSSPSPTPLSQNLPASGGSGSGGGRRSRSASRRQASMSLGSGPPGHSLPHRKSTTDLMGGVGGLSIAPSGDTQTHAIRKRRSASSWRGGSSRRASTTTAAAAAAAVAADGMDLPGSGISFGGDGGSGGGGAQIGFVNYTPDDHNVLMTGVAPSGSSKTKMRREKEAQERQRKLSEAVVKAVTAAGVDVSMLKEEGIVI